MMNIFRENKAVTLVALVITVVLMIILAGVTVTVSKDNIYQTKKFNFVSELEIIQQKVLVMNKEMKIGSATYDEVGTKYENLDSIKKDKVKEILDENGVTDYSSYIFMTKEDLLKIGLKNIKQNVIISSENSVVYSYDGVEIDGKTYYSIEEINKK